MEKNSKKIVISGVTRGLGRALVDRFTDLGHIVIGCGRTSTEINRLNDQTAPHHFFRAVDVADWQQVAGWASDITENGIFPDLLINNAAIMNQPAPLWEIGDEEFSQVMAININGTANMIRAFVPAMIKNGGGVIVNISSGWGRSTSPHVGPYCTSKWAIEGLTRSLSQELPAGIAAVAVNPGVIDTDMLRISWGSSAGGYQSPAQWARRAAPFLLELSARDNGKSLSI